MSEPEQALPGPDTAVAPAGVVSLKLANFPQVAAQVREDILEELTRRGLADPAHLEAEARRLTAAVDSDGQEGLRLFRREDLLVIYRDALLDALAAQHLSPEEIAEFINLARKRQRVLDLKLVLLKAKASPREIWRRLSQFCELPLGDKRIDPSELLSLRAALIENFISGHLPFIGVAKHHLTIRGICGLGERMIGAESGYGRIGGKAAGLLLAMAILHPDLEAGDPDLVGSVVMPRSYFVRSDTLDSFMAANPQCMEPFLHQKYKDAAEIEVEFPQVCLAIDRMEFPAPLKRRFRAMLQQIGPRPIIVRSSSYLEDSSGFAFSGKYESVFLTNQGALAQRLEAFLDAARRVYASTLSPDALIYRRERGLLDYNEQMCILVQEVVGAQRGDYFFPLAAGVATSVNSYAWSPRIRREDGLLRMVMGLGTRAVNRVGSDYARLVPLSEPLLRPESTAAQILRYSQREVDVLNLKTGQEESLPMETALRLLDPQSLGQVAALEKDGMFTPPLGGLRAGQGRPCLTFDGLLREKAFMSRMQKVVRLLAAGMGRPVELEFAYQDGVIHLLQCRSLASLAEVEQVSIPRDLPPSRVLFTSRHAFTSAVVRDIDFIVYVDAAAYDALPTMTERLMVGRAVGWLNGWLANRRLIIMGPGRWGTNNPELGVKVGYAELNHTRALIELAWKQDGAVPQASYGTHFFHDLVESNIVTFPVYPDEEPGAFNQEFFAQTTPPPPWPAQFAGLADCVKLFEVPALTGGKKLQLLLDGDEPLAMGFLADSAETR
ncbi:MAG: PEP/pyruvate-binding domain-containing protein [Deltaproteobacteria bacterium]|nr:PEP/pyruvate-binding domain-containing protein [Deltaproteobacteria bacterium]